MRLDAVFAFLVAMAVAMLATPLAARFARRVGAVSQIRERGLGKYETPLLGGLAILAGVLVAAALWMPDIIRLPRLVGAKPGTGGGVVHTWGLMAGAVLIAVVGALDDVYDLRPQWKLMGQIAAALVAVEPGAVVTDVTIPFVGALQFPNEGGRADGDLARRADERRQLLRRRRRARGRAVCARRHRVRGHRVRPGGRPRRDPGGAHRGSLARVPAAQLPPGVGVHGRFGGRTCSATCSAAPRSSGR